MSTSMAAAYSNDYLRELLSTKAESFWSALRVRTREAQSFEDLYFLATMRRRALAKNIPDVLVEKQKLRLAIVGGYTMHPLCLLVEQTLFAQLFDAEIWTGEYDNYAAEILDESSNLYSFEPDVVVVIPPVSRYKYSGKLSDSNELVEADIQQKMEELFGLCQRIHEHSGADVILGNFILPCYFDPGPLRGRRLASEWNSLKLLNLEIGLKAPHYVHVCDMEFLAARIGGLKARDDRAWLESKQPCSADFACVVANEIAQIATSLRTPTKKVLVVDLDETLWGGVIAEDGLNGIELGDTSARGQSYKQFQLAIRDLYDRGVLIAVCSKNDLNNATEPFEKHPEMILRLEHIASFSANWDPKSDNIIRMAEELGLGLDSFVFIDDNPAEIDIVRQFAPAVQTIWLGSDSSAYLRKLLDCRYFETSKITQEDTKRGELYSIEQQRKTVLAASPDFDSYLESLRMVAAIEPFREVDVPRITQLINKSNQFNLTTKRRTESEVVSLMKSDALCLSVRLRDRFGDLGLISIVVAVPQSQSSIFIDTWLMSCRVLKRQVEQHLMNSVIEECRKRGFKKVIGAYIPSAKNEMVRNFYPEMGFSLLSKEEHQSLFEMDCLNFTPFTTKISNAIERVDDASNQV